jgi:hypothetical protein
MSLDEKIRNGRLNRRDFLEIAARTAGIISIGSIPIINSACKKDNPITPPGPVTLQFDVYNHTKGYRTSFTRNTMSEQNVNIKISDIGYNDVDPQRIVVREKNMGKLAVFGRTGEANFTAPRQNLSYDIFLMNKSNGTNYALMDNNIHGTSKLVKPRFATWYRHDEDGKTGPQEAIEEVVAQFNDALNLAWISYGKLTEVNNNGDIILGYALCLYNGHPVGGLHATDGTYAYVNPEVCQETGRDIRGVFVTEIFELLTFVSDIHGDGSNVNGQDRYLTIEGQELLRYVYAKDENTK